MNAIRKFLEWVLSILFPPRFPKIKRRELWESWIVREAPVHSDLDPFNPKLKRWESWAGKLVEHSPIPRRRRYFQNTATLTEK